MPRESMWEDRGVRYGAGLVAVTAAGIGAAIGVAAMLGAHVGTRVTTVELTRTRTITTASPQPRRAPVPHGASVVWTDSLPLDSLVPENGRVVRIWPIRTGGGVAAQLVVLWEWGDPELDRLDPSRPPPAWGVGVWTRTVERGRRGPPAQWQLGYARRFSPQTRVDIRLGDVTSDGHPDVLIEDTMGSGGCGDRRIVATAEHDVRELLDVAGCETGVELRHGDVRIDYPGQPCRGVHAHCFRTRIFVTRRWDGDELRAIARSVVHVSRDGLPT